MSATHHIRQVLAITADNASANDVMIDELVELLESFRGQAAHARCFDHTLNLIVKTLLRQFDTVCRKKNADHDVLDAAEEALRGLASEEIDLDDDYGIEEWDVSELDDDNVEGWVDEREELTEEEVAELDATTRPAKFALAKVSAYWTEEAELLTVT